MQHLASRTLELCPFLPASVLDFQAETGDRDLDPLELALGCQLKRSSAWGVRGSQVGVGGRC